MSSGRPVSPINTHCSYACGCPAMLTVEEEIRFLEGHRKSLQDQLALIDRKIDALKSVKES